MMRRRLPPAALAAVVAACASLAGACDGDTQTNTTPVGIAGRISQSPTGIGLAGATPFTFTATGFSSSSREPLTYAWDFGDRSTTTGGPTVVHTYMIDWYRFDVSVVATTSSGARAQAGITGVTVRAVTGRWGIRDSSGRLILGSAVITQNDAALHGDDSSLNCRYEITGSVAPPRSITVTYTRPPGDCQARDLPISFTFSGSADGTVSSFAGTMSPGVPATMVRCADSWICG